MNQQPTVEQLQKKAIRTSKRLNPSIFDGRFWHLRRLRQCCEYFIAEYLDKNPRGRLLDYGCGGMPYRPIFVAHAHEYLGADLAFNTSAEVLVDENGRIDLPENSVDSILSTQVLEHVLEPDLYLKEGFRVLKPGGLMFLSTHGYWLYHPDPTDFWRWTRDGLEKTVERNGFEIVETLGMMNLMASGLQLFQDGILVKIQKVPLVKPVISVVFVLLQSIVDWGSLRHRDASVFVVIARKKENMVKDEAF
jgi:SAM-dependent methyltransferase